MKPSNLKRIILILLIISVSIVAAGFSFASEAYNSYVFKIKYGPLRIGTLVLDLDIPHPKKDSVQCNRITIDSNPNVFIVDFHNRYQSFMDRQHDRLISIRSVDYEYPDSSITTYNFDYSDSLYHVKTIKYLSSENGEPVVSISKDVKLKGRTFDLPTLLILFQKYKTELPFDRFYSFIDDKYGPVELNISDRLKSQSLENSDFEREIRFIEGFLGFKGVAGWTGYFSAWITNDEDSYPVKASLKVFLGSINIKLHKIEEHTAEQMGDIPSRDQLLSPFD